MKSIIESIISGWKSITVEKNKKREIDLENENRKQVKAYITTLISLATICAIPTILTINYMNFKGHKLDHQKVTNGVLEKVIHDGEIEEKFMPYIKAHPETIDGIVESYDNLVKLDRFLFGKVNSTSAPKTNTSLESIVVAKDKSVEVDNETFFYESKLQDPVKIPKSDRIFDRTSKILYKLDKEIQTLRNPITASDVMTISDEVYMIQDKSLFVEKDGKFLKISGAAEEVDSIRKVKDTPFYLAFSSYKTRVLGNAETCEQYEIKRKIEELVDTQKLGGFTSDDTTSPALCDGVLYVNNRGRIIRINAPGKNSTLSPANGSEFLDYRVVTEKLGENRLRQRVAVLTTEVEDKWFSDDKTNCIIKVYQSMASTQPYSISKANVSQDYKFERDEAKVSMTWLSPDKIKGELQRRVK